MDIVGDNLISYGELLSFLKDKGKSKNWFDALRTRYKLIHKPIIKPPVKFSIKERDITFRQGRTVFYLNEIMPYLEQIIRLRDDEKLTYEQIQKKMQEKVKRLTDLRKTELCDDKRVKPTEFFCDYEIAKVKLKEFLGWDDNSKEMVFLDYILEKRTQYGKKYYALTQKMRKAKQEDQRKRFEEEREQLGRKIDFCHEVMESAIRHFVELYKQKEIAMTAEDWRKVGEKMQKE